MKRLKFTTEQIIAILREQEEASSAELEHAAGHTEMFSER